jgi:hypothetical protein
LDAFNKLLEQSNLSSLRTPDAVTYTDFMREMNRRDESIKKRFEESMKETIDTLLQRQAFPPGVPPTFRGAPINLRPTFDFSHESGGGFGKSSDADAKNSGNYGGVKNPFSHQDDDDPGTHRRSTNPFDDDEVEEDDKTTPIRTTNRSGRTTHNTHFSIEKPLPPWCANGTISHQRSPPRQNERPLSLGC